jgi:hypothetical protein
MFSSRTISKVLQYYQIEEVIEIKERERIKRKQNGLKLKSNWEGLVKGERESVKSWNNEGN